MRVSRREVVRLASAGAAALLTVQAPAAAPRQAGMWDFVELEFGGPQSGNPYTDVELQLTFALGQRRLEIDGFYDGAGVYKARFMPDQEGAWTYVTRSNVAALNGQRGELQAVPAMPGVHGKVGVENIYHFAYADGTPYVPFGTTCYAWIHQSSALQEQTLKTLATSPFNKIRMCVFPKSYEYNHNEPELYPFVRDGAGKSDFTRPNPAFYAHLERRVLDLQRLGIEADLILFHPYDRWGYATMSSDQDDRYLRYMVARLAAFRNVWWSMANEFDLMRAKNTSDFDRLFRIVEQRDPYAHLRSVHYSRVPYDYSRPWVTHASLQTYDFDAAPGFRKAWKKPVVFDEIQYEGNLNKRWGNISGAEMMRRFWLGVINGCYVTHGETYLESEASFNEQATPTLWWSHGGTLHGSSPQGIAFLRKLLEEAVNLPGSQIGLDPQSDPYYLNASVLRRSDKRVQMVLYFFDFHQPIWYEFPLPDGPFRADLIDPEACTITPVAGEHAGKAKLRLSGKPFGAIRFLALT